MKAKKSLGQNFLKSEMALRKIIEAGEIKSDDVILEIGPGKGALTEKLLGRIYPYPTSPYIGGGAKGRGGMVIAVEKDRELFEILKNKFEKEIKTGKLILINDDILKFNMEQNFSNLNYKIIANIPYNITGAILKKFLTEKNQPENMVLMVQHEVAKRIMARDEKESILSISVKAYGEPKMIMKVPARYFSPKPKVDSAVILINHISRKLFVDNAKSVQSSTLHKLGEGEFEEKFWEIVKTGFAHKRKKLSSNLKTLKNGNETSVLGLGDKRAEDLTLADWLLLTKLLAKQ